MTEMVTRKFVVAHSALESYRTPVEMEVPADIADDPTRIAEWLNTDEAINAPYSWRDAFDPTKDLVNVRSNEIDGVDFDTA